MLEEGDYADSVSLAYYAMYLTAKVLLIKKEIYPKTHSGLIHVFGKEYVHEDEFDPKVYSYLSISFIFLIISNVIILLFSSKFRIKPFSSSIHSLVSCGITMINIVIQL